MYCIEVKYFLTSFLACLQNLGHLIRMPYGCGEQNMINFAPNVFILQYLTITRQATPEVTTRLANLMRTGVVAGSTMINVISLLCLCGG